MKQQRQKCFKIISISFHSFFPFQIRYITQNPGGGATNLALASSVSALIGTPPGPFRKQSQLLWRLGATYMIEDLWTVQLVQLAFKLGPHYCGSFQAAVSQTGNRMGNLVAEEKITFAMNANSVSQMTLAKLRRVYNKIDSKYIAKHLGISSHENITPIRILHNSASHLNGPARCIGGVIIGYLGKDICEFEHRK